MRLTEIFEEKVKIAIARLPILDMERRIIDYELIPVVIPLPTKEFITTFVVALFVPCGPGDHVTHMAQADNPYCEQQIVDNLVREIYKKVQEERDANLKMPLP